MPGQNRILRTHKTRLPLDYLNKDKKFLAGQRELSAEELPLEFFMNALRLNRGVPKDWFSQRTGLDFDAVTETWQTLSAERLVLATSDRLAATELGQRFLNTLLARF